MPDGEAFLGPGVKDPRLGEPVVSQLRHPSPGQSTLLTALAESLPPAFEDLGTKDFQCTSADTKGQCAGTYDWLPVYFTSDDNFKSFTYVRYAFTYHATEGGKGTWADKRVGGKDQTHGDIRALKKR